MKIYFTLLFIVTVLQIVQSAKILGVFPIPARSHYILGNALMKGLAEKGHDVTVITLFSEKNLPKKGSYKEILLTGLKEKQDRKMKEMNVLNMDHNIFDNPFTMVPMYIYMGYDMTESPLKHPNVQELLKSGETFDAVIVQQFMNEAHKGFAAHFNAPLILFSTIGANTWVNMLTANPAPPSYVPDVLQSYSSDMTFCERIMNTVTQVYSQFLYYFVSFPLQKRIYETYFPNGPNFYDLIYNGSIILLNSHASTNEPVPYVPSIIEIGGFHVQPSKKLPQDLQTFLDESTEGVIYFSMGSNLKSVDLPPQKRDAFLKTFSKLKQKVLWKWEEDVLPGQPKNVKLGKWLPQQDILAHPNVKLFITHGGLLSTTETVYHGVPVLAIPVIADQKMNAKRIVNNGFGLSLGLKEVTEETLRQKLTELLENSVYSENAKRRSKIFHDRQVKPLDVATYWVEYVIRHGGAPHLKVAGVDLPWHQYMLLDVIGFLVVVSLVGLYVFYKTTKAIKSYCFAKKIKLKMN